MRYSCRIGVEIHGINAMNKFDILGIEKSIKWAFAVILLSSSKFLQKLMNMCINQYNVRFI